MDIPRSHRTTSTSNQSTYVSPRGLLQSSNDFDTTQVKKNTDFTFPTSTQTSNKIPENWKQNDLTTRQATTISKPISIPQKATRSNASLAPTKPSTFNASPTLRDGIAPIRQLTKSNDPSTLREAVNKQVASNDPSTLREAVNKQVASNDPSTR